MRFSRLPGTLSLLVALTAASPGCKGAAKPKAGDLCKLEDAETYVCKDARTALLCRNDHRVEMPCHGRGGCDHGVCDGTEARAGDACAKEGPSTVRSHVDAACDEDHSRSLACKDGTYVVDRACRGPDRCDAAKIAAGRLDVCDRTVAAAGDPCESFRWPTDPAACSADGKSVLTCDDLGTHAFVLARTCDGPRGCTVGRLDGSPSTPMPSCDQSVESPGAPCGSLDGHVLSCSADGRAVVFCDPDAHVWKNHRDCGPKARCAYEPRKAVIDGLACR